MLLVFSLNLESKKRNSFTPADPVDVLRVLQLPSLPEGVQKVPGFCTSRRAGTPDNAYRINKKAQISAPTKQLFSGTFL